MRISTRLPLFRTASLSCALLGLSLLAPAWGQDATPPPAPPAGEGQEPAGEGQKPAEGATPEERKASKREARLKRQAEKRAARQNKAEGRPLAPDAPEAKALEGALNVAPRYASDGTVRLVYPFKDIAEQGDFVLKGFDAAEAVAGGGRGRRARKRAARLAEKGKGKNIRFELVAGSRGALLLHKLSFEDDFKITLTVHVVRSTNRSDFVAFVGKGGARFGSQPVVKRGSKFSAVNKSPIVRDAFEGGKQVKIELVGKDGELTTKINGVSLGNSNKLKGKLDGQFGIYLSDMVIQIHQLEILGRVDARKLPR